LRNGDRLTAEEYERRYDAMPGLKKAELINGVVYMLSPVTFEDHGGPHFDLITWLGLYRLATPGVRGGDNSTLRLPLANRPQPDACLIVMPSHGGQVRMDEQGYIVGAPELIAEVAASSENYDLHDKLEVYRQNNAREYVVWRVLDRAIDWFVLRNGQFVPLPPVDGIFRSETLPGLWLDAATLVNGDMAGLFQTTQQGVASPEHRTFIDQLQKQAARS